LISFPPSKPDSPATYLALETDNIEAGVERIQKLGGQFAQAVWENKDVEGRGISKRAIILDPDGNTLLLHEIASWREKG
jgi:predicted enzyme related to lactoylglutathione lyase